VLPAVARKRSLEQRRRIQIVFQNPADALNPRQTIGAAISRPAGMWPAADPAVIVCDEITSALDASVHAAVLALLAEFQRELGLALLFITHDLGVVANIADEVLVLEKGRVSEQGSALEILRSPDPA
jgi:peptide/nickel transport system ATP-binding protein